MDEQECIPVGCVSPAAVAFTGGVSNHPPTRTRHPLPDQASPQEQTPSLGADPPGADSPPGQTNSFGVLPA